MVPRTEGVNVLSSPSKRAEGRGRQVASRCSSGKVDSRRQISWLPGSTGMAMVRYDVEDASFSHVAHGPHDSDADASARCPERT
jgi:hypothetical protein